MAAGMSTQEATVAQTSSSLEEMVEVHVCGSHDPYAASFLSK